MTSLVLWSRTVLRSRVLAGAMTLVVACTPNPPATQTAPPATASTATARPVADTPAPSQVPSSSPIASPEGTTWDRVFALESGSLGNLVAGPDGLIVAGCRGDASSDCSSTIVVMSTDADTWEPLDLHVSADISFASLHRLGARLYALGYGHYGVDGGAVVLTSVDGRTWSRIESSSFRARAINDIVDSPSGALAIGYEAPIDSDNTSGFLLWPIDADGSFGNTRVVDATDGPAFAGGVLWTGDEFLAWGYRDGPSSGGPTSLLTSRDGKIWTARAEIPAVKPAIVEQITIAAGRLVAVGYEGLEYPPSPRAWTSTDAGRSWQVATVPSPDAAMYTVSLEGSLLIARGKEFSGANERIVSWSSADGTAWTRLPDDEDMPTLSGFSALSRATIGDRTCVAGTFFDATPVRAAIYCH